jgi:hypothetical protein
MNEPTKNVAGELMKAFGLTHYRRGTIDGHRALSEAVREGIKRGLSLGELVELLDGADRIAETLSRGS